MNIGGKFLTTRWAVRMPIPLFKAGFGFLFGGRILLLQHIGRVSGTPRYVVLEVVLRESATSVIVASGFGPTAQWYRNLEANPRCRVSVGWRSHVPARAEMLDAEAGDSILATYSDQHPFAWKTLKEFIVEATGEAEPTIPMVRLRLGSAD